MEKPWRVVDCEQSDVRQDEQASVGDHPGSFSKGESGSCSDVRSTVIAQMVIRVSLIMCISTVYSI